MKIQLFIICLLLSACKGHWEPASNTLSYEDEYNKDNITMNKRKWNQLSPKEQQDYIDNYEIYNILHSEENNENADTKINDIRYRFSTYDKKEIDSLKKSVEWDLKDDDSMRKCFFEGKKDTDLWYIHTSVDNWQYNDKLDSAWEEYAYLKIFQQL